MGLVVLSVLLLPLITVITSHFLQLGRQKREKVWRISSRSLGSHGREGRDQVLIGRTVQVSRSGVADTQPRGSRTYAGTLKNTHEIETFFCETTAFMSVPTWRETHTDTTLHIQTTRPLRERPQGCSRHFLLFGPPTPTMTATRSNDVRAHT